MIGERVMGAEARGDLEALHVGSITSRTSRCGLNEPDLALASAPVPAGLESEAWSSGPSR